jgi:hypothetical protein
MKKINKTIKDINKMTMHPTVKAAWIYVLGTIAGIIISDFHIINNIPKLFQRDSSKNYNLKHPGIF